MSVCPKEDKNNDLLSFFNVLSLDLETRHKATTFYQNIMNNKNLQKYHPQEDLIMRCAVLLACKSTVRITQSGQKIRGISLPLSQILKDHPRTTNLIIPIKDFFQIMANILKEEPSITDEIASEIHEIMTKFTLNQLFYSKYCEVFSNITIQCSSLTLEEKTTVLKLLKNIGWILNAYIKDTLYSQYRKQLDVNCCLLACSIKFILYHSSKDYNFLLNSPKNQKDCFALIDSHKEQDSHTFTQFLCSKLIGFSDDELMPIIQQAYMTKLTEDLPKILKISGFGTSTIVLTKENMQLFYQRVESHYQTYLNPEEIDETYYLEKFHDFTPIKCTLLGRQSSLGMSSKEANIPNIHDKIKSNNSSCASFNFNSSLEESIQAPYYQTPIISQKINNSTPSIGTPFRSTSQDHFANAMGMYHWLNNQLSAVKLEPGSRLTTTLKDYFACYSTTALTELLDSIDETLSRVMSKRQNFITDALNSEDILNKFQRIYSFFLSVLQEILIKEEMKFKDKRFSQEAIKNVCFLKSLLALCIEIFFFIVNDESINFSTLLELTHVSALDFWKNIAPFGRYNTDLPTCIKRHLYQLEFDIMFEEVWKTDSPIFKIIENIKIHQSLHFNYSDNSVLGYKREFGDMGSDLAPRQVYDDTSSRSNNLLCPSNDLESDESNTKPSIGPTYQFNNSENLHHDIFFKRLLHLAAVRVIDITKELGLQNERTNEEVWNLIKHVMSEKNVLLVDRHLDQLIFCSFYIIDRYLKKNVLTFESMFRIYSNLKFCNKKLAEKRKRISTKKEKSLIISIIQFYNSEFLEEVKPYLLSADIKNESQGSFQASGSNPRKRANSFFLGLDLESPLKQSVMANKTPLVRSMTPNNTKFEMGGFVTTPIGKNNDLLATCESPFLKNQPGNSMRSSEKSQLGSQRKIDFTAGFLNQEVIAKPYKSIKKNNDTIKEIEDF